MGEDRVAEACRVAGDILEHEGWGAVTMRRVADQMGMRAPSLYKHIRDKDELRSALIAGGIEDLGRALAAAGPDLEALAAAYRRWALARPHLYELATSGRLDRSRLPEGLEDRAAEPLWTAAGEDENRARAIWAAAHGLAVLEISGRFPDGADVDAAWAAMVAAFKGQDARDGRPGR
jgi:AcrR family transcriptional regulator